MHSCLRIIPMLLLCATACFAAPNVPKTAIPAPAASEQKLSIDVKDTDIRDVIRMISKGYDLNILLDQDITGKVTLHLVDVPIMEGLRSIAASNDLEVIKDGSVYNIKKTTAEQKSMIRYASGKLTVDIQNVDVRDFLKELSSKSAVSIVPDVKVAGPISGKLYQVDFDDGLRALLEGNGYTVLKRKKIYQVAVGSSSPGGEMPGGMARFGGGRKSSNGMNVEYSNGKVSVDVVNGDLEEIVRAIAEQSEAQIITYGSIKSEINAKLDSVPLTQALALLLGGTRFTFVQKDNVILIGDRNTATPSGIALSKSELIHLRHIKADNIPSILPKDIPATNVRVIKEQNALLISGTSEDIVSAIEFLKTIDIPTPQVRIDAVIVEFKENIDKEFGIRGGLDKRLMDSSYVITPFPQTLHTEGPNQNFEIGLSGKYLKSAVKNLFPKSKLFDKLDTDFFGILRFLESQAKAKVLAQPSILTLNGNKASIDVSETQYFKVETGVGENHTSRFQPIKFGIQLDITPWISQSGQITAEITPNVSNSEKTNNEGYPNVSTRSITTTVRLNDGQTLILGGLIKNQETNSSYKIPFLGDLPFFGGLFRHSGKTRSKSNLMVFITPHIIEGFSEVNLAKELEKYEIHDMNILEKSIHEAVKRRQSRLNDTGETIDTAPDATSAINRAADTTVIKEGSAPAVQTVRSSTSTTPVKQRQEPSTVRSDVSSPADPDTFQAQPELTDPPVPENTENQ